MRFAAVAVMLSTALLSSACATVYKVERSERRTSQGIPPGHMPPAGSCRVWYDHRPPGHQPAPTSCREAERIAARERGARVIYSENGGHGKKHDKKHEKKHNGNKKHK